MIIVRSTRVIPIIGPDTKGRAQHKGNAFPKESTTTKQSCRSRCKNQDNQCGCYIHIDYNTGESGLVYRGYVRENKGNMLVAIKTCK
ncbi:hypothetical protein GBAR_LOCUS12149, partial [Geodia barretti]